MFEKYTGDCFIRDEDAKIGQLINLSGSTSLDYTEACISEFADSSNILLGKSNNEARHNFELIDIQY